MIALSSSFVRNAVTRFAPSPTGQLHLGHAYSALFAANAARASGGRFLLRIEDIDQTRCRAEYIEGIYEYLRWLGLTWESPVRRQSEHFADYQRALQTLEDRGLIYPCFCTRKDISSHEGAPHGPEGTLYPGTCRDLPNPERHERMARGESYALRLDIAKARLDVGHDLWFEDAGRGRTRAEPEQLGDVVLARKDSPASYHLAVTLDDALQGVTLVTRGVDLFHATHLHRLLQALLGLPVPRYHHHPLLLDDNGKRFAKRDRAVTLASLRAAGWTPGDVRADIQSRLAKTGDLFTAK
jgi:glutamyl-Q tRNA(Asp) synthetase